MCSLDYIQCSHLYNTNNIWTRIHTSKKISTQYYPIIFHLFFFQLILSKVCLMGLVGTLVIKYGMREKLEPINTFLKKNRRAAIFTWKFMTPKKFILMTGFLLAHTYTNIMVNAWPKNKIFTKNPKIWRKKWSRIIITRRHIY